MLTSLTYIAFWVVPGAIIGALIARARDSSVYGGLLIGAALAPLGWIIIARSESLKAIGSNASKPSNAVLIAGLNVAIVTLGILIGGAVAVYLDYTQPGEGRVRPSEIQRR